MGAALSSLTAEAMRTIGTAIVGSPNEVVDGIQNLQEQLGFDVLLCQVDFGAMPGHVAESSLRLLIEEVVPSFR
jgi:alkanesulfonate monooxygenase SsuD/methylene tetrahydromethanopterin reductase-like flavin-dependent oxidoreductase (luciferase family)